MRVAAIEDKLAQLTVSEDEMRAYQKEASLTAGRTPAAAPLLTCVSPVVSNPVVIPGLCVRSVPVVTIPSPFNLSVVLIDSFPASLTGPVAGDVGFARLGQ